MGSEQFGLQQFFECHIIITMNWTLETTYRIVYEWDGKHYGQTHSHSYNENDQIN